MILLSEICPRRVPAAERGPGHRAREAPRGEKGEKREREESRGGLCMRFG